jgi:hypothetical protein
MQPAHAARLMERAARLSVRLDAQARRRALAAELWLSAAVPERVARMLDGALVIRAELELAFGEWDAAQVEATEAVRRAQETGQQTDEAAALSASPGLRRGGAR